MSADPDADLLAMLDASPNLFLFDYENGDIGMPGSIYDGDVEVNEADKTISVPLPYIVYYSTPGYDRDERLSGQVGGRVLEFDIHGVGEDRNQAKWVLDQARDALSRKYLNGNLIIRSDANLPVGKEDTYTRPGGGPLFFGVDRYKVAV